MHTPTYLEVLDRYAQCYRHATPQRDVRPQVPMAAAGHPDDTLDQLRHLAHMHQQMREFVATRRHDKAMRWLNWMQGVLWSLGYVSLDECRDDTYRILNDGAAPPAEEK